jgi:hypothetical protein
MAQKRFSKPGWYRFIEKQNSLNGLFVNTELYSRTGHRMFECECAGDLEGSEPTKLGSAAKQLPKHRHVTLAVERRLDATSRCCRLTAEQIVAAPIIRVMGHDAVVKATRLGHQRIHILGQQKTSTDDVGRG